MGPKVSATVYGERRVAKHGFKSRPALLEPALSEREENCRRAKVTGSADIAVALDAYWA